MNKSNRIVLLTVMSLAAIGVIAVYSTGTVRNFGAPEMDGASLEHFYSQLTHVAIGLLAMLAVSQVPYQKLGNKYFLGVAYLLALVLLELVLVFGVERLGARRWFSIAGVSVQPSDLTKPLIILVLAALYAARPEKVTSFLYGFVVPMVLTLGVAIQIGREPDIGTPATLVAVALAMAFMAGVRYSHLVISILPPAVLGVCYVLLTDHGQARINAWLDPLKYPQEEGYQLIQSLRSFSLGGFWGKGLGAGQQKLGHLPEAHSDFIFAIWGEETGFLGVLAVILLFALFVVAAMRIAKCAPDMQGSLIAAGVGSMIAVQALLNMGVTTGLLPTKGLTLPFISAGGTSVIINLAMIGLLLNVGSQAREKEVAPARRRPVFPPEIAPSPSGRFEI